MYFIWCIGLSTILVLLRSTSTSSSAKTPESESEAEILEVDSNGEIILEFFDGTLEINITSIPTKSLKVLKIFSSVDLVWDDNTPPIFFDELTTIELWECRINPHSMTFSSQLTEMSVVDAELVNGSIDDLLRTANSLRTLVVQNGNKMLDIGRLPYKTMTSLEVRDAIIYSGKTENCNQIGNYTDEKCSPTVKFDSLQKLCLRNLQINSHYMVFGDKLITLDIEEVTFTNQASLTQLIQTFTNLEDLTITDVEGIVDVSELDLKALTRLVISSKELRFQRNSNILKHVKLENLKYVRIYSTIMASGALEKFLKNARNLEYLYITTYGQLDFDICMLPATKSLLEIQTDNVVVTCTDNTIVFATLKTLSIESKTLIPWLVSTEPSNFNTLFPSITELDINSLISPSIFLSVIKLHNLKIFSFFLDVHPQKASYNYGECLKFLLQLVQAKDSMYEDDVFANIPKNHPSNIMMLQDTGQNGTLEWKLRMIAFRYPYSFDPPPEALGTKHFIYIYGAVLIFVMSLGIIGNTLSACVLAKSRMWTSASGIVLFSLTFFDAMVIITYLITFSFSIELFYSFFFKGEENYPSFKKPENTWTAEQNMIQALTVYPVNKIAYTGSVYLTVFISLERFVAICYPLKSKIILSYRNTRRSITVILAFSVILNFPRWIESLEWSFNSEESQNWNEYYKPMLMRMDLYVVIYHHTLWPILMYLIPFLVIGVLNFKILQQMRRSIRARPSSTSTTGTHAAEQMDAEMASLNRMLLCVVAVFVICNALYITLVFYFFFGFEGIEPSTIEAVAGLPLIVNSSVNFIIYVGLGKKFRSELMKLTPKCIISCWDWCRIIKHGHSAPPNRVILTSVNSGGASDRQLDSCETQL